MAILEKLFNKIIFKDYPDTSTPLNADNLNKMSNAIDGIDDRVVELNSNFVSQNKKLSGTKRYTNILQVAITVAANGTSTTEIDLEGYNGFEFWYYSGNGQRMSTTVNANSCNLMAINLDGTVARANLKYNTNTKILTINNYSTTDFTLHRIYGIMYN